MKKSISIILILLTMMVLFSTSSFAQIGDVIGYAKYTDISAYINHYPIKSYNINDYTAIVVEDLRNYGFDVTWNDIDRTLSVVRSTGNTISGVSKVYKYGSKAGQNSFAYVETDIITLINGQKVESFNIGGQTCIYIDSLNVFGGVEWDSELRAIKLWISDLPKKDYAALEEDPLSILPNNVKFYYGTSIPTYDSFTQAKYDRFSGSTYWYKGTFAHSQAYQTMLEQLGWEKYDWSFKEQTKIGKNGVIRQIPYAQHYYYRKDGIRLSFSYYSDDGDVAISYN